MVCVQSVWVCVHSLLFLLYCLCSSSSLTTGIFCLKLLFDISDSSFPFTSLTSSLPHFPAHGNRAVPLTSNIDSHFQHPPSLPVRLVSWLQLSSLLWVTFGWFSPALDHPSAACCLLNKTPCFILTVLQTEVIVFFSLNLTHFLWLLCISGFWLDQRLRLTPFWLSTVEPCRVWWIFFLCHTTFCFLCESICSVFNIVVLFFHLLIFYMCLSLVCLQTIPCLNYFLEHSNLSGIYLLEITFLEGFVLLHSDWWYYTQCPAVLLGSPFTILGIPFVFLFSWNRFFPGFLVFLGLFSHLGGELCISLRKNLLKINFKDLACLKVSFSSFILNWYFWLHTKFYVGKNFSLEFWGHCSFVF